MRAILEKIRAVAMAATCLWAAFAGNTVQAAMEVRASVSQSQVTLADTFEYRIEISGDRIPEDAQPVVPDFSTYGFQIVSGPSSEQRISIVNGAQTSTLAFRWLFQPTREGTFEIAPVRLAAGRAGTLVSNSVRVVVAKTPAVSLPGVGSLSSVTGEGIYPARTGNEANDRILRDKLFLRPVIDKTEAYVGEQITLRYDLYQSPTLGDLRYGIEDRPDPYRDFLVEVLYRPTQRLQFRQERVGDNTFLVAPIEAVALFATKTGATSIPAFAMTADIPVQSSRPRAPRSVFDDFFLDDPFFRQTVRARLVARPLGVRILPLPPEGKPANFSGTVGEFQMAAAFDRNEVQQYDLVNLKVLITGKGQIEAISPPRIPDVSGLQRFKEQSSNQPSPGGDAVSGTKTFEFVLRTTAPGEIKFPSIEYVIFNPKQKRYERLQTQPLALRVLPAPKSERPQVFAPPPVATGAGPLSVEEINRDIDYIQTTGFLRYGLTAGPLYQRPGFLLFQLFPVGLLAVSYAIRRRRDKLEGDVAWARRRSARSVASRRLRGAGKLLAGAEGDRFFEELSRALRQFVADFTNESAAGLTAERIGQLLADRGVENQDVAETVAVLDLCEAARYSSSRPDVAEMRRAFDRASELIDRLARKLRG